MNKKIILVGGGGHCRSCIDVIEQEGKFKIVGIVDLPEKLNQSVLGYPVIGTDTDLPDLVKKHQNVLITVGQIKSPVRRIELFAHLKGINASFPVIKSPMSYVSPHASVDEGTIVMHNALINAGAQIGRNCIINTKALVEHDAVIEDHCHISTGTIINGGVIIGRESFIGSGSITKEYISISSNTFLQASSFVGKSR